LVTFFPGPTRPFSCRLFWFFLPAADERGMDEGSPKPRSESAWRDEAKDWDQAGRGEEEGGGGGRRGERWEMSENPKIRPKGM
jgi:hypothetical protein